MRDNASRASNRREMPGADGEGVYWRVRLLLPNVISGKGMSSSAEALINVVEDIAQRSKNEECIEH